jgi:hypothetical protein
MTGHKETYERRMYRLRDRVEEEIDAAITDVTNEVAEAIGAAYDECEPDYSSEEAYWTGVGAREALWLVCKSLDIDPESVREGWGQ